MKNLFGVGALFNRTVPQAFEKLTEARLQEGDASTGVVDAALEEVEAVLPRTCYYV